jgi:uncharacterized protein (TIGR00288 family)
MTDDSSRLAVLIDADNTSAKVVTEMFEELASYGTLTVKRAYGDWTNDHLKGWREVLLGNAISPQQQFAYTAGKNATDSALIIDAMDLLYSGNVDGFAIVSSDSDFTPLATRLREAGKRVIGVGGRKTPKAFIEACERFLYVEVLAAGGDSTSSADPVTPVTTDAGAKEQQPRPLQSVLTKALNKVKTDDDNWVALGPLGDHLNRTDPSFDARAYGFPKLGDLVKAQGFLETKTVTGSGGGGQLLVRLKGRRAASSAAQQTAQQTAQQPGQQPGQQTAQQTAHQTVKKAAKKAAKKVAKKG